MSSSAQDKLNQVQGQMANAVGHAKEAAQNVTSKVTDFFQVGVLSQILSGSYLTNSPHFQGNPFETPVGKKIGKCFIHAHA
jgi:hypothetical protein